MEDRVVLDKRKLIAGAEIFTSLGEAEIDFIAANSVELELAEGVVVFDEGETGDSLYIVESGNVGIERSSGDGGSARIAELIAGDCFGELDLLTQAPRTGRARILSPSRLIRFPASGASLSSVMEARPQVSAKLLRSLLAAISGRIRKANAMLRENSPLVRELRRQVYGDKLSGLNNKTWLEENLSSLCASGPL
ncbi:MAG: cyclic nucleotide-binding domain-containing protein, partial [Spirochaetaceae bacterium]|nr:cyclic nucleotide-binding domain-containing protein [Spirochaetaceae bacterium]